MDPQMFECWPEACQSRSITFDSAGFKKDAVLLLWMKLGSLVRLRGKAVMDGKENTLVLQGIRNFMFKN